MSTLSNNIKVLLFPDNYLDHNQRVNIRRCITVQDYEYRLGRNRNAYGEAYGSGAGNLVSIKVSVGSRDSLKVFYDRLTESFRSCLTLIFDASYDDQGFIDEYSQDGALVIDGYIVDIEEDYERNDTDRQNEEITLTLKVLANKMTVVGSSHNIDFRLNC